MLIDILAVLLFGIGTITVSGLLMYCISQFEKDKEENEVTENETILL